jgi:hypothetical protein
VDHDDDPMRPPPGPPADGPPPSGTGDLERELQEARRTERDYHELVSLWHRRVRTLEDALLERRALTCAEPALTTGQMLLVATQRAVVCTIATPWNRVMGRVVLHPRAYELLDMGERRAMRCPVCQYEWTEEKPH